MELQSTHKKRIKEVLDVHGTRFKEELNNGEWKKDREHRISLFQQKLSKEHLAELTESEFAKLIGMLWASMLWGNKEYHSQKIISDNGIEKIRSTTYDLFYGDASLPVRYDNFSKSIKGLGPSSITEIMVHVEPQKYSLWNDKPKNILPYLGLDSLLSDKVFKYQINGKDYEKCHEVLTLLKVELEANGLGKLDYLDLDIFLWLLFNEADWYAEEVEPEVVVVPEVPESLELVEPHWDIIAVLADLGNILGYDTYVADPSKNSPMLNKILGEIATLEGVPPFTHQRYLDTVRNVDILWFYEEFPTYGFEVEHSTGVTPGLLRLYQIRQFSNTKFFIIAPESVRSRFETEVSKDPFDKIKPRYNFRSYEALLAFYEQAKEYHQMKHDFLG